MKKFRFLTILLVITTLFSAFCVAAAAEQAKPSPLKDLNVLFVGDSICEAYVEWNTLGYTKEFCGWAARIEKSDGIHGTNYSKSGASLSNCRGTNTILAQLQKAAGKKFDLVVLHGGVNDAWDGAPVGKMETGFDASFDKTTFGGGLEATIAYAKKTFPDAKLCFVINFALPAATKGVSLTDMSAYFALAKKICDKWNVPYLDLYNNNEVNTALQVATSKTYLHDHIHPTSKGYDVLSPYIAEFLRSLYTPKYKVGDVNGNGGVDPMDYMFIRSYYLKTGTNIPDDYVERMNLDGKPGVTPMDIMLLRAIILGTYKPDAN